MDKTKLIFTLLILEAVILLGVIGYLYMNNAEEQQYMSRVVVTETSSVLGDYEAAEVCPTSCEKQGYDGWQGTGGFIAGSKTLSCDCYWDVTQVPVEAAE